MAALFFDADTVAPQAPSTPIPAGVYLAQIIESDVVPTKTGSGEIFKLTFEVMDGQFKGRKVFENLNIKNSNPQTQQIAQSQLSAICHAVNVIRLTDSAALHFKPLKIKVVVKEAEGQYSARNNIKGYESVMPATPGAAGTPPSGVPAATPAAAKPATNAPAWAKRA